MKKRTRNHRLSIVLAFIMLLAGSFPAEARIGSIGVEPPQPACHGPIVLQATGWWPDGCWRVDGIDFAFVSGVYAVDLYLFTVHATDSWVPGAGCTANIVEYSATETLGPLPEGTHYTGVIEEVTSLRETGQGLGLRFEVVCCDPAPRIVAGLRLDKQDGDRQINLTWLDTPDADDYVVFEAASPNGDFVAEISSAAGGTEGTDVTMPVENAFYLVAGRNACGVGAKR